jgi:hypothetical protein
LDALEGSFILGGIFGRILLLGADEARAECSKSAKIESTYRPI